jgi:hypothetical protein
MKILFRIALVILVLSGLAIGALILGIDSLAKTAVEEGGSFATGVETRLGSADVGLFSGKFGIEDLSIDNPEGFQDETFFTLAKAGLQVDPESVSGNTIVIPELLIEGVHLSLERTAEGTNYGKILENLERFEQSDGAPEPEPTQEPQPGEESQFNVQNIVMRDVTASVKFEALGEKKEVDVKIPDFTIENVGNSEDSQSIGELFSIVLQKALDEVVKNGGSLIPEDMKADVAGRLAEVEALTDSTIEEARQGIQDVLDGTDDGSGLKETADKAKQGLKGLLDKD